MLDGGHYDKSSHDGALVLACIQEAREAGWINISTEKDIILWRWLIVAVFIEEELEKNGTIEVPTEDGGVDVAAIYAGRNGAISIYPGPLRFALASHAEGAAIEKYGESVGLELMLKMYHAMITDDPERGFKLTAFGREGLELLHDGFIDDINANGLPSLPVIH